MNTLDNQIRQFLIQYLVGRQSLSQFIESFVPASWNIQKLNDPILTDLVGTIELCLAEHSNAHLSEAELKAKLSPLLRNFQIEIRFGTSDTQFSYTTGSAVQTQEQSAGIELEVGSV